MRKTLLTLLLLPFAFCQAQTITSYTGSYDPLGLATDDSSNLYISVYGNNIVQKVNRSGIVSTFAGTGAWGYSGDGGPATAAKFNEVLAVAADHFGNLYIADGSNNVIRKVNASGIISTVAGNGTAGYSGDGGPATLAKINLPNGITTDASGNLYIADLFNNVVRKVNVTTGIITTVAGTAIEGYTGDGGPATSARLHFPSSVAFDHSGNMYIADENNFAIRKVNAGGIITTIAGAGTYGYDGDGLPATAAHLGSINQITFDHDGNLYMADLDNNVIRKVATTGIISTFAGNGLGAGFSAGSGSGGYAGDFGPANTAELDHPEGLAIDAIGNMFISDNNNGVVRKISAINGIAHICVGDTVSYTTEVGGGTWSSSAPLIAQVNATGRVTALAVGTATIYYSIGNDTASVKVFVVNTPGAGTIYGSPDSICYLSTHTYLDSIVGGEWTLDNTAVASLHGSILTGVFTGSDTLYYTINYSCGIAVAKTPINVIYVDAGFISGPLPVCLGDTLQYTDTTFLLINCTAAPVWSLVDSSIATLLAPGLMVADSVGFDGINCTFTAGTTGCFSQAQFFFSIDSCNPSGISVPLSASHIDLYPNPSNGAFTLVTPTGYGDVWVTITDLTGRTVYTTQIAANITQTEINLNVPSGAYLVKVQTGAATEVKKIIVDR